MKRTILLAILVGVAILVVARCTSPTKNNNAEATDELYTPVIDPANYNIVIDHPYFPLKPGIVAVFQGETEKGYEYNEVYVTSETKEILGVTCVVVSDTVKVDGRLEEATLDWYAQDKQGNVWYFGEDSKEYDENGNVSSTEGSWEAGVDGAKPGIIMEAAPKVGDIYRQEYYQGVAEDMASVLSLSETANVPFGAYTDVLMTKEWSALDPAVVEQKYYARDIGLILVVMGETERLELVQLQQK